MEHYMLAKRSRSDFSLDGRNEGCFGVGIRSPCHWLPRYKQAILSGRPYQVFEHLERQKMTLCRFGTMGKQY